MLKEVEFYFIRHGQTDWNLEERCMGQTDIPLNETGIAQASKAASILQNTPIQTICYSPLSRTKKTAELINAALNCPMIAIDALKECGWGIVEGRFKENGKYLRRWFAGENFEGAEEYPAFIKRALEGVNEALQYPKPLIVSHGGIYWGIQSALGLTHEINSTGLQNCVPYYHKPPAQLNTPWWIEPVEKNLYYEPFEVE